MKRQLTLPDRAYIPEQFHPLLEGTAVYDSSCSSDARVFFIDREGGFYLKSAPKGTLLKEAAMTRYFHHKGLAAEVLSYESLDRDWLLTTCVPGEDCTFYMYMGDPVRLCDTTAQYLRMLHSTTFENCPVADRTANYLATARRNYISGSYNLHLFPKAWSFTSPEEAWAIAKENGHYLKTDTLLHGDYCLPNIILDNWCFSGFIDLDTAGVGDRHVDLFWAIWSLNHNLKTDRYHQRFLDAYGRESVNEELFRIIAAIEVFG